MTRRSAVAALVFGLAAVCSATAIAEPITYFIESVTLPDGYAIEGGHITTNGTLGSLSNTDVLDYEVRVTGAVPYVFGPGNPQSDINAFRRVNATSTEIEIAEILEVGNEGSLGFIARENDLFIQGVRWSNSWVDPARFTELGYYLNKDFVGLDPDVEIANLIQGESRGILVASVPEPSCMVLSAVGTFLTCIAARRKRLALRQRNGS